MFFFIITGQKGEGKTYLLEKLAELLKQNEFSVGGIVTRGQEEKKFVDINTKKEESFWKDSDQLAEQIGNYKISKRALSFAEKVIEGITQEEYCFIDEMGWLEADKKGLYRVIKKLLDREKDNPNLKIIAIVRRQVIEKIKKLCEIEVERIWFYERKEYDRTLPEIYKTVTKA